MRSKKIHIHSDIADKNFIPVSRRELIKSLVLKAKESSLDEQALKHFRTLSEVLQTIYHARYHRYYQS